MSVHLQKRNNNCRLDTFCKPFQPVQSFSFGYIILGLQTIYNKDILRSWSIRNITMYISSKQGNRQRDILWHIRPPDPFLLNEITSHHVRELIIAKESQPSQSVSFEQTRPNRIRNGANFYRQLTSRYYPLQTQITVESPQLFPSPIIITSALYSKEYNT